MHFGSSNVLCGRVAVAAGLLSIFAACGPTQSNGPDGGGAPVCVTDQQKNGSETDIDCGGGCLACGPGRTCTVDGDCFSNSCKLGFCQNPTPTCDDERLNGTEVDVDCGGDTCDRCAPGKACVVGEDCQSGICQGQICTTPTCTDGVKNGLETGVDCGGGECPLCANGEGCAVATDCSSGVCTEGVCLAPTCTDGAKNGAETDVDCGGPDCGSSCADGKACTLGSDCVNAICAGGACLPGSCTDSVKNNGESDVDCGGANCAKCQTFQACTQASDCVTGVCFQQQCQPPSCTDSVKNGTETDADCGGGACSPCADNQACATGSDCVNKICNLNQCAPATCFDGVRNGNEPDVDCGQGCTQKCAWNQACSVDADCIATVACSFGACTSCAAGQADCNLSVGDGCEIAPASDVSNCGGCGLACSTQNATATCVGSTCTATCAAGFGDCDFDARTNACETDLMNDPLNCGGCGISADDGDPCTDDLCVNGVAQHTAANVDDGDLCTMDACSSSSGITHTPKSCDDMNTSTCDRCDPANGMCLHDPVLAEWDFSSSAGWTLGAGWEIAPAASSTTGSSSFGLDPSQDHSPSTDDMELGAYISPNGNGGNIPITVTSFSYATSPVVDLSTVSGSVYLDLWRVLNSDYPNYMDSTIEVYNGTSWVTLFSVPASTTISESAWTHYQYDVTTYKNSGFRVRFGFYLGSTSAYTVGGWNVDDVRLLPSTNTCQ